MIMKTKAKTTKITIQITTIDPESEPPFDFFDEKSTYKNLSHPETGFSIVAQIASKTSLASN